MLHVVLQALHVGIEELAALFLVNRQETERGGIGGADAPFLGIEVVGTLSHTPDKPQGNATEGDEDDALGSLDAQGFTPQVGQGLSVGEFVLGPGASWTGGTQGQDVRGHGTLGCLLRLGNAAEQGMQVTTHLGDEGLGRKGRCVGAGDGGRAMLAQDSQEETLPLVASREEMTLLQDVGSEVARYPLDIVLILKVIEGTGAVDEKATRLEGRPYVTEDAALTLPAERDVLQAPVAYGSLILAEHALAGTGNIGDEEVELMREEGKVRGIVLRDDALGIAPLGHVLRQHLCPLGHGFVAHQPPVIGQQGTQQGALSPRSCTEVEGIMGRGGRRVTEVRIRVGRGVRPEGG